MLIGLRAKPGAIHMKTYTYWAAVVAVTMSAITMFTPTQSLGQGGGVGFRMMGDSPNDPSYLLTSESVQKELAISDDQKANLQKQQAAQTAAAPAFFRQFMGLPQDEMQKRLDERAKEIRNQLSKILTPKQMDRLAEIYLQVVKADALNFDEVAKKLGLTVEQKEKLRSLGEQARSKSADLMSVYNNGQPVDREKQKEIQQKLKEVKSDRAERSLALLTEDQKTRFEQLQGAKFDISTIQPKRESYRDSGRINAPPKMPVPQQ
jgi:hypothetical protein